MRFAFTAEQVEFRDQLRTVLADLCPPGEVRAAWTSERGWSPDRWRALSELGVVGLTVPTEHGGLGLGPVDLVGLLQELGWAAAPEPVVETTAVAVPLLVDLAAAGVAPAAEALEAVARGDVVVAVAVPPSATAPDPAVPAPAPLRVAPATADLVVALTGDAVTLVPAGLAAVTTRQALDGTRRPGSIILEGQFLEGQVPGPVGAGPAAAMLTATVDRGATAVAAVLLGLAERMLAMAAEYAGQRRQFGQVIGSFQAVKHRLADVAVRLEHARPAVYRAAWSLQAAAPTASRDASMAKALATDAALDAARAALQVHGAVGSTWEHDLHLWMKRAWSLAPAWGGAAWHRARVLAAVRADLAGGNRS